MDKIKNNKKASYKNNNIIRRILLYLYDFIMVFGCGIAALKLVDMDNFSLYFNDLIIYCIIPCILTIVGFTIFKLYTSLWKYVGIEEFLRLTIIIIIIFAINILFSIFSGIISENALRFPSLRWCAVFALLQMFTTAIIRFMYRTFKYIRNDNSLIIGYKAKGKERVMIVGAGEAGASLIKEIRNHSEMKMAPICIIDDNLEKLNKHVEGIKVAGNRQSIPKLVAYYHIQRIIIAIPTLSASELSKIILICKDTKCKIQTIPSIYQMINTNGSEMLSKVRDIQVEDLLGRDPVKVDLGEINEYLKDKVVLVTGGGGSIGSELCRQIAESEPKQLIILDFYENNAYEIEQELLREKPGLSLVTLIASVRDVNRIDDIFSKYRPEIIFHAAAHKHVPLMEASPNEAVKNNVVGTLNVVKASDKYEVKRFIFISTDKAVNPTNVMGATKRICEMIIQAMDRKSKTEFVATRFGNVLNSNGSVIPLFKRQIEKGGPVTITHKDITRFFMTIPEAVSLVLQAGSYAKGGEIFVLDMGKPVKIYDLAVNLIKLSGYTPDVDIKINIIGLRPGEKLYEEILMSSEGFMAKTPNELIFIEKPLQFDDDELFDCLSELSSDAYKEVNETKNLLKKLVKSYNIDNGS